MQAIRRRGPSHPEQRQQALIEADAAEAGEGDQDEQADSKPDQDLGRSQSSRQVRPMLHGGPASGEIVAADRLVEGVGAPRRGRNAGPARRCADALGLDERAQDRQRQVGVTGLDRLIQPIGQFALARQRAVPFALVIGEAADLPLRQFQIDQRQRGVGPGLRLDQPLDAGGFGVLIGGRKAPAGRVDDIGEKFGRDIAGVTKPVAEVEVICCSERSDMGSSRLVARPILQPHSQIGQNAI